METMKKIFLMAILLCSGLGAWADNNITLSNVQGAAGTEVTVSVSMTNTDAVSAIQLSIPLDENLTFVENSQQAGSRISGHTLSAGVKDGVLNIMVYSVSMAAISGNEGDVCSFKLLLGNNPGIANLVLSKAALTGTDGSSLAVATTAGTVDIRGAKAKLNNSTLDFGRVAINGSQSRIFGITNVGNETLTITDVVFSSNIFSISDNLPLTINAGNSRYLNVYCKPTVVGAIDEEMTIVSNSVSDNNTIRLIAICYGANELRLESVYGITDEEVTVPVTMKNTNAITGLQMEIEIPNELEYVDGSFVLSSRKQDHVVTASETDGKLSVATYSPTDKPFTGNEGEVGCFKVKIVGSNDAYLGIKNAKLSSTVDGETIDVLSGSYGCTVSIRSPYLYSMKSINFGRISINEQHVEKSFTIHNRGSAPLIISNITFENELFSINEELPITIDPLSNERITVLCEARERGDIGTNMVIYSNDPNRRIYNVTITGEIYTPDYLTATADGNRAGVNLDVSLNNYSDIYGIQFDVNTTKDFTASANDVILTERGNNLSVSINSIGEGKLRVVAYAKNGQFVSSGEGKVMTIKLVPKEVLPEGDYSMTLNQIVLGAKDMQNVYEGEDIIINFGVNGVVPGDANKDGKIGIGDIIAIENIMAGKVNGYDLTAADANQDNKVDIEDIYVIINFMAGR